MDKKEVIFYNENGDKVVEKLMIMSTECGNVSIEEAEFSALHRNIEEIYHWAKQGEEIYQDLVKVFDTENPIDDVIMINRQSRTLEACIESLQDKYQVRRTTAETLVNMPLSELTDMSLDNIKDSLAYYSLAVKQLRPLIVLHSSTQS